MSAKDDKPERRHRRRRRRPKREPDEGLEEWKLRLEKAGFGDKELRRGPSGQEKMSDVLWAFIEPYRDYAATEEALRKLLTTALIAWTAALQPEDEREASIARMAEGLPADKTLRAEFREIVHEMIERKLKYFAKYDRPIVDYELADTGTNYHLSVVSLVTEPPEQED